MAELLPCPFCGHKAEFWVITKTVRRITEGYLTTNVYNCGCKKCGIGFSELNNKALVVEKWNTRTPKERGGEK